MYQRNLVIGCAALALSPRSEFRLGRPQHLVITYCRCLTPRWVFFRKEFEMVFDLSLAVVNQSYVC